MFSLNGEPRKPEMLSIVISTLMETLQRLRQYPGMSSRFAPLNDLSVRDSMLFHSVQVVLSLLTPQFLCAGPEDAQCVLVTRLLQMANSGILSYVRQMPPTPATVH